MCHTYAYRSTYGNMEMSMRVCTGCSCLSSGRGVKSLPFEGQSHDSKPTTRSSERVLLTNTYRCAYECAGHPIPYDHLLTFGSHAHMQHSRVCHTLGCVFSSCELTAMGPCVGTCMLNRLPHYNSEIAVHMMRT